MEERAMRIWTLTLTAIFLAACGGKPDTGSADTTPAGAPPEPAATEAEPATESAASPADRLAAVLASQPDSRKARYPFRHPQETLEFFGIEPGMTVVEGLPGGGWYTRILVPYLGDEGTLIGVDYTLDMFPKFGSFSDEQLAAKERWAEQWLEKVNGWRSEGDADVAAYTFATMPADVGGTADAVLMIRAMHNLARFENDGGYLSQALAAIYGVLKPGGIVGIVQHEAPADAPDDWADGSRGYLKRAFVIAQMEKAGFELVGESDINANPKDQPTESDFVWRLPPTFATAGDDEAVRNAMLAIGESNRMTLKFRKPE
jgi:predicted methyltransferase